MHPPALITVKARRMPSSRSHPARNADRTGQRVRRSARGRPRGERRGRGPPTCTRPSRIQHGRRHWAPWVRSLSTTAGARSTAKTASGQIRRSGASSGISVRFSASWWISTPRAPSTRRCLVTPIRLGGGVCSGFRFAGFGRRPPDEAGRRPRRRRSGSSRRGRCGVWSSRRHHVDDHFGPDPLRVGIACSSVGLYRYPRAVGGGVED